MTRPPPKNAPPARRKPGQGVHTRVVPGRRQTPPSADEWADVCGACSGTGQNRGLRVCRECNGSGEQYF